MKTKLINFWESLRASFWFLPALMVIAATLASFSIVSIDKVLDSDSLSFLDFFYLVSPDGARAILSTIAGSMMTVACVTFSITTVVLSLASSQFGPRLLRNFMLDRGTQFVLGTFVASFIYCLLVLRSIKTIGTNIFVPCFAVTLAVVLAFLSVGVLIFFIHHIATSIQADQVVAAVSRELDRHSRQMFTEELGYKANKITEQIAELQEEYTAHFHNHPITSRHRGYLQAIDVDGLLQTAEDSDYVIHLLLRPGQFVAHGCTLAVVSSEDAFDPDLARDILDAFIIGEQRTPEQDTEYSIHQLVEIAIRALSPGINDPYTAIACIDQLGSALCYLAERKFPPSSRFDAQGRLRLRTKPFTFPGILNASFDQIRQYGSRSVAVTIRLLEMLTIIAGHTRRLEQRTAIHRQADMILRASRERLFEQNDKEDVQQRYQLLLCTLQECNGQEGSNAPADKSSDS